jgi:hypothetical protein
LFFSLFSEDLQKRQNANENIEHASSGDKAKEREREKNFVFDISTKLSHGIKKS